MSDFIWVEKYRPQTIEDCILPDSIKKTFQEFLNKGEIPNMLLSGPPGVGKTTVAKALCKQLGVDYYVVNGSDEGRFLDTVRNNAKNFASTVSLTSESRHKVIIIDEADNTTSDVQLLLRASIEEFSKHPHLYTITNTLTFEPTQIICNSPSDDAPDMRRHTAPAPSSSRPAL